jgi:CheY-like chemotaxis protein
VTGAEAADRALDGVRVLVVEDEGPVAMLIEDMLEDLGCAVVGSAANVTEALALVAAGGFDIALLDVNLAGEKVDPVARALTACGLRFAFVTGYGGRGLPQGCETALVLPKPFRQQGLKDLLGRALQP